MTLPKLGLVSIGVHDDVLNWIAKYKPVSIIVVNERGQARPERPWENSEIDAIRKAMGASPKTLWIFRSWPDGIGENIPGWPLWDRLIKCFEPFRQMSNPLMAHGYNEPGDPWVFTERGAQALASIEIKFAERIHAAGLLYGGLCFPESHLGGPNLDKDKKFINWGNILLWKHLAPVLEHLDAWIPNEYDWPWVFTSRDQGYKWRIGHYEHQLLEISKHCSNIPPVIIGEGILDGKIKYPHPYGWQKQGGNLKWYVGAHQDVHNDTYHNPRVFSHHTFCYCHESSEWRSYNVKVILPQLGQLITDQQYWSHRQGGGSMDIWKNVPSNIAQWRPLIEKITSTYPVPIPDYKGIHVSPAKVITCIIKIESNGDPKAVGGAGHAHGLMQVWKDHYPGKNLFDPEVNIRTGLEILKAKLGIAKGNLSDALYYYSGGTAWASKEGYLASYWQPFLKCYADFWGVDLEPKPQPAPPQIDVGSEIQKRLQVIDSAADVQKKAVQELKDLIERR